MSTIEYRLPAVCTNSRGQEVPNLRTLWLDAGQSVDSLARLLQTRSFESRLTGLNRADVGFRGPYSWSPGVAGIIQRRRHEEALRQSHDGFGPTLERETSKGVVGFSEHHVAITIDYLRQIGFRQVWILWFQNTTASSLFDAIGSWWSLCGSPNQPTAADLLGIPNVKYAAQVDVHAQVWAIVEFSGAAGDVGGLLEALSVELGESIGEFRRD